jgi:hypothetical protein
MADSGLLENLYDDAAAQCFFQEGFFVCGQSEDHRQEDVEKVAIIGRKI